MRRIAITGGIGSGKTAVTNYLQSLGYPVVDADESLTRVTQPGSPTLEILQDAFGPAVINSDGSYNRAFVSHLVFSDDSARGRLNSITHRAIGIDIIEKLAELEDAVVFVAIPLFRPAHREMFELSEAWAIVAPVEIAVDRLVQRRGMIESEARSRIASQISNEERIRICEVSIDNSATLDMLQREVDETLLQRDLHV